MKKISRFKLSALAVATAVACSPAAFATNGYFSHAYGTKSSGMGGVGVALPQDAISAATNPANMALVGSRADAGIGFFSPLRDSNLDTSGLCTPIGVTATCSSEADSGATLFLVPGAGFVMDMAGMTMGFTMYANGGMNTRYNTNIYTNALAPVIGDTTTGTYGGPSGFAAALEAGAFGSPVPTATIDAVLGGLYTNPNSGPALGVNLAQLILAPSVSMKVGGGNHVVGVAPLIGYQRFRAYGLGLFQALSSDPSHVTNKGDDDAWGAGVRIGYTGKLTDSFSVGATASSKIYMQEFKEYGGLFAEQGDFDIPANFALGVAFQPDDTWTVAFDVERILYGDVAAIANAGPTADEFLGSFATVLGGGTVSNLGSDSGWGFGWEDMTIYKLGIGYKYSDQWSFRGGVNYGASPIPDKENLFNILAPGVVETHATLGLSYSPDKSSEVSLAYMHAFRKDQSYTYSGTGGFTGFSYDADIGMSQNSLEVSYGIKF